MKCLVARYRDERLQFPLPLAGAMLGSSRRNDLVVGFPGVSRAHASVKPANDGLLLTDAGSKNGIVVDGSRRHEYLLTEGAAARIGRAVLTIEDASTSDVLIAIVAGAAPLSKDDDTAVPSSGFASKPNAAAALAVVRAIEKLGDRIHGRRRATVLTQTRASLGADSLMLMDISDDEIAVAALAGAAVEEATIRRLAGEDSGRRKGVVVAERSCDRTAALVARRGSHTLLATFERASTPSAWQRDLFAFVAEKLLRGTSALDAGDRREERTENDLVLQPGFVTGQSAAMRSLLDQLRSVANARIDVLVTGETGSGKELVARALHASGWSRDGGFVAINCAAIPGDLLESELFGVHGRVATGVDPRQGLVLRANGGTLFLDEIAELPERLQAKLLRVLQEREVLPLGASRPIPIDLRVVAASNRDLRTLIHDGRFRADLYYRLRGLELYVPSLRERREDIPQLALEFLDRAALELNKRIPGITRKALDILLAHDWPGNVRELASDIRRAVLVASDGAPLRASHFAVSHPIAEEPSPRSLQEAVDATERREIERALAATGGNRTRAARLLGITRNGLALKLRRHDMRSDKPLR